MFMLAFLKHPPTPMDTVGIAILLVASIVFVPQLIAKMSGWKLLAQRFRYDAPFVGTVWKMQCAQFHYGMNYNNCLTVGASNEGMYLAMLPLVSFGHAPLLIPWSEITEQGKDTLFGPVFVLTLGRAEQVTMKINSKLALKIEEAKKENFPIQ